MVNVSDKIKTAYKTDRFPMRTEPLEKHLSIKVLDTGTIIDESSLESENFTLDESICSDQNVTYGACEASMVSFAVYNIPEELNNKVIEITQAVDGEVVPFGTYRIWSAIKRDGDSRWRDIVAYDRMTELDKDVAKWYKEFWTGRTSATLKEFRVSFFDYVGFDIVEQNLTNDNMVITNTINPKSIKGRYVAQKIGEINACFGHFTRENKFKYISLSAISLYPSETLFPAEDLFPSEGSEMMSAESAVYFASESHYEDFCVQAVDSVTFRNSDDISGYTVTFGDTQNNPYIIDGNFLLLGKSNEELKEIAYNFLLMTKNKTYVPNTTVMIGLPYMEVGDTVSIMLERDAIETFIFQRKLTGIHSLMDSITATGTEYRQDESSDDGDMLVLEEKVEQNTEDIEQNTEDIKELNENLGDINIRLEKTDEGLLAEVTRAQGAEESLGSRISLTEGNITAEVTRAKSAEESLSSRIELTAESIELNVSNGEDNATISLTVTREDGSTYTTTAKTIKFNGDVIFASDLTDGTTKISGDNIKTGTISAGRIDVDNLQVSNGLFTENFQIGIGGTQTGGIIHIPDSNTICMFAAKEYIDISRGLFPILHIGTDSHYFHGKSDTSDTSDTSHNLESINNNHIVSVKSDNKFSPSTDNKTQCGSSTLRWSEVFAGTGTINTSDRNYKTNIKPISDKYIDFFELLAPVSFQFTDGKSGRTHIGFISQDVEWAMGQVGLTDLEFAGFCKDVKTEYYTDDDGQEQVRNVLDENGNPIWIYSLRYSEFIALNTAMIQRNSKRIDELTSLLREKGVI